MCIYGLEIKPSNYIRTVYIVLDIVNQFILLCTKIRRVGNCYIFLILIDINSFRLMFTPRCVMFMYTIKSSVFTKRVLEFQLISYNYTYNHSILYVLTPLSR